MLDAVMSARVVCLHGLRRTPDDWSGVRAALAPSWTADAPALPADPDAALRTADATVRSGDVVFAHSMGAIVALRLLREHPRPLRALVLTGCFFPPARNGRGTIATGVDYTLHRVALLGGLRLRGPQPGRSPRSRRALMALLRETTSRRSSWSPPCPVLVVHARDDHHVPVDFAIAGAARHPDWALRLVDHGGHHLHVDHPARWLAEVLPWLETETRGQEICRAL